VRAAKPPKAAPRAFIALLEFIMATSRRPPSRAPGARVRVIPPNSERVRRVRWRRTAPTRRSWSPTSGTATWGRRRRSCRWRPISASIRRACTGSPGAGGGCGATSCRRTACRRRCGFWRRRRRWRRQPRRDQAGPQQLRL